MDPVAAQAESEPLPPLNAPRDLPPIYSPDLRDTGVLLFATGLPTALLGIPLGGVAVQIGAKNGLEGDALAVPYHAFLALTLAASATWLTGMVLWDIGAQPALGEEAVAWQPARAGLHVMEDLMLGLDATIVSGVAMTSWRSTTSILVTPLIGGAVVGAFELLHHVAHVPDTAMAGVSAGLQLGTTVALFAANFPTVQEGGVPWAFLGGGVLGMAAGGWAAWQFDLPPVLLPAAAWAGLGLGGLAALSTALVPGAPWPLAGSVGAGVGFVGSALAMGLTHAPAPHAVVLSAALVSGTTFIGTVFGAAYGAMGGPPWLSVTPGLRLGALTGLATGVLGAIAVNVFFETHRPAPNIALAPTILPSVPGAPAPGLMADWAF